MIRSDKADLARMLAPDATTLQHVAFAILCAKAFCSYPEFVAWADGWLSGADRTREAAQEAVAGARRGAVTRWAARERLVAEKAAWAAEAEWPEEAAREVLATVKAAKEAAWAGVFRLDLEAIAREALASDWIVK